MTGKIDIYKELKTKESYDIKYRFIEQGVKDGKIEREIVNDWLCHIDTYTYGGEMEEEMKGYIKTKIAHINFYKTMDIVGELVAENYKEHIGTKRYQENFYKVGKTVCRGTEGNNTGRFRGVEYIPLGDKLMIVVKDEAMHIERKKEYHKAPSKNELLYDMAFYLDTEYLPYGKPGTVGEIMKTIKESIKNEGV